MTDQVLRFTSNGTAFVPWGHDAPHSKLGRLIGSANSQTMGVGYMNIDSGDSIQWTVLYDEVLIVTAGQFRLRLMGRTIDAGPGDVFWIPKGTPLSYEGEGAQVVYVIYPVNWRALQQASASA